MQARGVGNEVWERAIRCLRCQRVPPHGTVRIPGVDHQDPVTLLDQRAAVGVVQWLAGRRIPGMESDRHSSRGARAE